MKKYLWIAILIFTITSCKKVLETTPEVYISDEAVITDSKSSLAALIGVYDGVQGFYGVNLVAHNVIADNVVSSTAPGNIIPTLTAAGSGAFDPTSGAGYAAAYVAINRANYVISKTKALTTGPLITEANKNQYVGEAYFLRALVYFNLVRTYGGVPIILEPTTSATQYDGVKRSSVAETYAQVLTDLTQAEALLTTTVTRSRANLYTVYALKARYYLYTENWDKAEEYASKVIANATGFVLVKPYSTFYTTTVSTESIFELVFNASDKNPIYTYYLASADGGRLDYIVEPGFAAELLDANKGGTRKSLIKLLTSGAYSTVEYGSTGSSSLAVLRIAEQYLIRAEARVKKSSPDLTNAIVDLNAIKSRASVPLFVASSATSADEVLLAIETERRYEFAFEGHRFSDIVRTGRAATIFGSLNALYKDSGRWVFPIPYTEIVADPDLEQNAAYK